jgi:hypothetical protein
MTTLRQQNAAITLTTTAKAAGQAAGVTLAGLQTQLDEHLAEAGILLKQIIAIHPSSGGDATNYSARRDWFAISDVRRFDHADRAELAIDRDFLTMAKPVRLLRHVGGEGFEFVHDQMHAYLAARWFAQDSFSVAELEKMVAASTIWTQAPDARRTLWGFAAALLDNERLVALWARIEDNEDWDVLRRALKAEAERRALTLHKSCRPCENS